MQALICPVYKKKKKGILIWCIYGGVCQLKPTFERPDFMNAGHFSVMRARTSVQAQSAEALQVPNATLGADPAVTELQMWSCL